MRVYVVGVSTFVDPSARFEADSLGDGGRVLAYAHVAPGVAIGRNCVVHEHAVLIGDVTLDDNVDVHVGAQILGPVHVEQSVTIGAGAVVGVEPPSGGQSNDAGQVIVRRFASIGVNAAVLPGVVVGRRAVVEAGSVVKQSVPANAIVSGNPATIVSYVDGGQEDAREIVVPSQVREGVTQTRVQGVTLHRLTYARDLRGSLTAEEFQTLPFAPQRFFTIYDVPNESVRGAHAHRECSQFLVCLAGALTCLVDDSSAREEVRLASPEVGLHIPPMVWGTQWKYTRDAVLLVFASHPYDAADYIRDYEEFLGELERERA